MAHLLLGIVIQYVGAIAFAFFFFMTIITPIAYYFFLVPQGFFWSIELLFVALSIISISIATFGAILRVWK